jgi:hypothetical protein
MGIPTEEYLQVVYQRRFLEGLSPQKGAGQGPSLKKMIVNWLLFSR